MCKVQCMDGDRYKFLHIRLLTVPNGVDTLQIALARVVEVHQCFRGK